MTRTCQSCGETGAYGFRTGLNGPLRYVCPDCFNGDEDGDEA